MANVLLAVARDRKISLAILITILLIFPFSKAIEPNGASVTETRSERAAADSAGSAQAQAGNVTQLNIFGYSVTQTWQGYFGNVTGTIELADASGNALYNWSLANPQGEVYASTNQTITWTNIQCFNFTATGAHSGSETSGATSLFGTNLTLLESQFNINPTDVDGVDETFAFSIASDTHDQFFTANQQFSAGECLHAKPYSSSGTSVANQFEEVLLYEPTTTSVVYAALLEEATIAGFDGSDYDFQMLVLEDGHGTDTDTTTYYFFVELE